MDETEFWGIDLKPIWPLIEFAAEAREKQKRGYQSSRLLRGNLSTHEVGLAGEVTLALFLGRDMGPILARRGDNRYQGRDAVVPQTTTYWPPILKQAVGESVFAASYALLYLNENTRVCRLIGQVSGDALRQGVIQDFGHGDNLTVDINQVCLLSTLRFALPVIPPGRENH